MVDDFEVFDSLLQVSFSNPFGTLWGPFWGYIGPSWKPLGGHLGPLGRVLMVSWESVWRFLEASSATNAQEALQMALRAPWKPPKTPRETLRNPPGEPQEGPKGPPRPQCQRFRKVRCIKFLIKVAWLTRMPKTPREGILPVTPLPGPGGMREAIK